MEVFPAFFVASGFGSHSQFSFGDQFGKERNVILNSVSLLSFETFWISSHKTELQLQALK